MFSNNGGSWSTYLLSAVKDRNGNTTTLAYTGTQLTRVTDANGRSLSFSYQAGTGLLASVTDTAGRSVAYGYTWNGGSSYDLTSVTNVLGGVTHYAYTSILAGDWLSSITDPLGHIVLTNTYDSGTGRISSQQDAGDGTTRGTISYQYQTPAAGITKVIDQRGKAWLYYFDATLRPTDLISPLGVRISWAYDDDHNVTRVENTQTVIGAFSYDSKGNQLTAEDALGYFTTRTYDSLNDLLTVTDPRGYKTTNGYDAKGNLTSTQNAGGFTTTRTLTSDGTGHVASVTDPLSHTTSYGYTNSYKDLTSVTDPLNHATTTAYDAAGRPTSVTDALSHTASTTYDAAGDVLTVTDALGNVTTNTYNTAGEQLTQKLPRSDVNQTTTYTYDPRGLLKTVTDPNSGVTTYGYDATWNRTSVQDARGKTTTYAYTNDDNLLSVTDPLSRMLQSYIYDTVGRAATRTDGRGVVTTYAYDAKSQVKGTSYTGGTPSVSAEYDALGNRIQVVDGTGATTYAYDALSRLTQVTFPGNRMVQYSYDAAGNRTQILYQSQARPVTYAYDSADRLTSVTDWNGAATSYSYDAANRLTLTTLPASTGITSTFAYDNANRLTSITHAKGSSTLAAYSYTLDADSNRTAKASSGSAIPTGAVGTESYTLDILNRLTNVTYANGGTTSYGYDAVGNRMQMVNWLGTTGYTIDNADQLTGVSVPGGGNTSYTYDNVGKVTVRGSDSFTWDGENQLTAATINGHAWSFTYNRDGLRFTRADSGGTAHYTWDLGAKIPQILDDGSGQYVYGSGLVSHIVGGSTLYYLPDALGTTNTVVDSNGNVVLSQTYDEYGNLVTRSGSAYEEFQFAGQQTDPSGLQYLRARYYDPATGRFLSRDPSSHCIYDPASYHPYTYAANNAALRGDPTGLIPALSSLSSTGGWLELGRPDGVDDIGDPVQGTCGTSQLSLISTDPGTVNYDVYLTPRRDIDWVVSWDLTITLEPTEGNNTPGASTITIHDSTDLNPRILTGLGRASGQLQRVRSGPYLGTVTGTVTVLEWTMEFGLLPVEVPVECQVLNPIASVSVQ